MGDRSIVEVSARAIDGGHESKLNFGWEGLRMSAESISLGEVLCSFLVSNHFIANERAMFMKCNNPWQSCQGQ